METTLKQRILGIIVLVALLGFCLAVLLRGNKNTQPQIAQINTHPPITQTTTAMIGNNPSNNNVMSTVTSTPPSTLISTPASTTTTMPPAIQTAPSPSKIPAVPITSTVAPTSQSQHPINPAAQKQTQQVVSSETTSSSIPTSTSGSAHITPITTAKTSGNSIVSSTLPASTPLTASTSTSTYSSSSKIHHPTKSTGASRRSASLSHEAVTGGEKNLVVQVGTFTLPANAETLVDKLHAKGFVASIQKVNTAKGQMTRVIVGKKNLNRSEAQALRQKLQKSLQINGIIVSHEPAATATKTSIKKASKKSEKGVSTKTASTSAPATIEDSEN
jgi:cell division septation protein DedD